MCTSHQQLFLICPFCQLETFLTQQFGNAFFLTAPASVFYFDEDEYLAGVKQFIEDEGIQRIYLVGDVSCYFVQNTLNRQRSTYLRCENYIKELLTESDSAFSLTHKLLRRQKYELTDERIFGTEIQQNKLQVQTLITSVRTGEILKGEKMYA